MQVGCRSKKEMRTTWRYPVPESRNSVRPGHTGRSEGDAVRLELGRPCLSARGGSWDRPPERRTFLCVRTLDPLPPGEFRGHGSAVLSAGRDVIHLVELLPLPDSRPGVAPVGSAQPWYEVEVDTRAVFGQRRRRQHPHRHPGLRRVRPPRSPGGGRGPESGSARRTAEEPEAWFRAALSAPTGKSSKRRRRSCCGMTSMRRDSSPSAWQGPRGRARRDPPRRRGRSPRSSGSARRCAGERGRPPGRRERTDRRGGHRSHRNREARRRHRRRHVREPSAWPRTRGSLRGDARRAGDPALLELRAAGQQLSLLALEHGAAGYLPKEASPAELVLAIRTVAAPAASSSRGRS